MNSLRSLSWVKVVSLFARERVRRAASAILTALALAANAASAQDVQLGEAPLRFESQDTSSWSYELVPKAAKTRDAVAALYHSAYLPGNAVTLNWTGSIATCGPGTTNAEHQQAVIARINYFRALVDLPAVSLLGATETTQVQAAALMMSANNALSHAPPMSWLCYSATGASGAASSNIALGLYGVAAIDLYMDDFGAGNTAVGHRRWLTFPPRSAITSGDVPGGNTPPRPANVVYVFGPTMTRPATPTGIAWPPAGFVPFQNLPLRSNRWSLSYPGADFTKATVTMTGPGGPVPVTLETISNGFGDNTIVFLPQGVPYSKPNADTNYQIVVNGISGAGVPATIQYTVTVIDPDVAVVSAPNYQGLWWYAAESGWGINLAHQGDLIYLTWYTYESTGKNSWLAMLASKTAANEYKGDILELRGPSFSSVPFAPPPVPATVGTGTLTFVDASNGTFAYTAKGVTQSKPITRFVFGPQPVCTYSGSPNFAAATNYQDLWWNSDESGWGINLSHQGSQIYATWYTYDTDGSPLWLASLMSAGAPGSYTGSLLRFNGPPFGSTWDPARVVPTTVGNATLTVSNGNALTWSYTIDATSGSKPMTRFLFRGTAGTLCQ